jgi:hypothetical protein
MVPVDFRAICIYDTHVTYGSARKCRQKFRRKFRDERVPSRQTIHNLVNEFRTTGLLRDKKQKHKRHVPTEEKLNDIGTKLEHTPGKLLKRPAQETGVSKSSAKEATQLLKLRRYKTAVIHARLAAARCSYQGSFLQLVSTACRRRWDRSAVDVLFWWSVVSLSDIHKYAK